MKTTRRELFAGVAAVAAGAASASSSGYKPVLNSQFYIWVQKFDREHKSLADGVTEAIAGTRRAGFHRIELMGSVFADPIRKKTLAALREHGLAVPIVYNGTPMHEAGAAEKSIEDNLKLAEAIRPAGARIINFNPSPKPNGTRKTDEELAVQALSVNRMARELSLRGVELILHHHTPEMADNAREWRHLLRNTEVGLCLDLHWIYRGGNDPLGLLEEAGKRVRSLHVRNSKQGVWSEDFGGGDLDYGKIAAYLKKTGYSGYLVVELAYDKETRITRSLEEDLRLSREYAEKIFAVKA
jgi:inosose dehydratase